MPRLSPDHRARALDAIHQSGLPYQGDSPLDIAYLQVLRQEECGTPAVAAAVEWYNHPEDRHIFDALFLSHATDMQISETGASPAAVSAYRHLYFDIDVFWHDMDRRRYPRTLDIPQETLSIYRVATDIGPAALLTMVKVGARPKANALETIEAIAHDQAAQFFQHRGANMLSDLSKEARKWGNDAVSSLCSLIDKRRETSQNDAKVPVDIRLLIERTQSSMAELGIDKDDVAG